jgi:hypothetical protein
VTSTAVVEKVEADAATAEPETAHAAPPAVTLASLGPFYDAEVSQGWLTLLVDADPEQWEQLRDKSWDPFWAGSRALPQQLRDFPTVYVVWAGGVEKLDKYARAGVDVFGWKIDYRPNRMKGAMVAMANPPPEGTTMRAGAKVTRIKKTHPMAVRMQDIRAAENDPSGRPLRPLRTFELQTTAGRFGAADRVIAISGWSPPPPDDAMDDFFGVVFTADGDGNRVQQVAITSGMTTVVGLVDIDGDGVDEILTNVHGYEYGSRDLHRLSPSGIETVNLWRHAE